MSFEEKHPIGQLLLDVLIAFSLFVGACLFAGTVQHSLMPEQDWSYILWLTLGCIPLVVYLQYRLGDETTRWDFLFFLPIPFLYIAVSFFVEKEYRIFVFVALIVLARGARDLWMKFRTARSAPTK